MHNVQSYITYLYVCMYTCIYMSCMHEYYICVYIYIYIHITYALCIFIVSSVCLAGKPHHHTARCNVCVYIYIHVHLYIHIYIHTYIQNIHSNLCCLVCLAKHIDFISVNNHVKRNHKRIMFICVWTTNLNCRKKSRKNHIYMCMDDKFEMSKEITGESCL
jgi:hypothetical protein